MFLQKEPDTFCPTFFVSKTLSDQNLFSYFLISVIAVNIYADCHIIIFMLQYTHAKGIPDIVRRGGGYL